jgi:transposase
MTQSRAVLILAESVGDSRIGIILIQHVSWNGGQLAWRELILLICVAAVLHGLSCRAVAVRFDVSVASVVKWAQRARETGSPAARPMGGKRPYLLAGQRSWLLARLDEKPDLTLHTLLRELGARGVTVSCDTLWRFLRREGFSFKKKRRGQRARAS